MKNWLFVVGLLALVAVIAFWATREAPRARSVPAGIAPTQPPAVSTKKDPDVSPASVQSDPVRRLTNEPQTGAEPVASERAVVEKLRGRIRDFGMRFGGNPVGTNAEITKALIGGNEKGVHFLDEGERQLNDQGELLDPWGTPYFFHQLSAHQMEIRSAGPNRIMWNGDDEVVK